MAPAFTVYDAERKNPTAKDLADGQSYLSALMIRFSMSGRVA
jgi:hypothetical protein